MIDETAIELLATTEMAAADRLAIASGVPSVDLMARAGEAVTDVAGTMVGIGARILVLAGPGNNGGDAFVAARRLAEQGYRVRLALLGDRSALKGDAAHFAARWPGPVEVVDAGCVRDCDLIIDGLFGAGLSRAIEGSAAAAIAAINASGIPVLAIDVPSGLDGSTGAPSGPVVKATRTVTFFRCKPGHVLLPGRALCGPVTLADIGIPPSVLGEIACRTFANAPALWRDAFPVPKPEAHKYTRGHAVVVSGPAESTGAARLSARGALRMGAGLVTVASPRAAFPVNAAHLTAIMLKPFDVPDGLAGVLADKRRNAVLIGPGCGRGPATSRMVEITLRSGASVVLDADAITSFEAKQLQADADAGAPSPIGFLPGAATATSAGPERLFAAIKANTGRPVVLTPHEGEFRRLFGALPGSHLERARHAAAASGAVIILKGPDTCVAAPDGRAAINENAPPWLATAGSGDVLAGFVAGLLAQGMPAFEAAAAAVWLHGACAAAVGAGLIAEDLPEVLPKVVIRYLYLHYSKSQS
ncbi:MAG TPA: NAD(P)H-hydrate dehydratase [Hyphomicrobiaceae bacterium]|nr:NAD(P)H-hydrate dehydratase [Hyphomicrobiaceae bacterium]